MSNMAYCRFQNTAKDLDDCLDHINDNLSAEEDKARRWLIELCQQIADYAEENDEDDYDDDDE